MKIIKPLFIVAIMLFAESFTVISPCLQWDKNYKIAWSDFLGTVPTNTEGHGAITNAGINCSVKPVKDSLQIIIEACFNKEQSWVVVEKETEYALNHEQRHFDLAEVHARMLRQYALKWDGKYNINAYISEGSDLFLQKLANMQVLYDKETDRSRNKPYQQLWNKKIDSMLTAYCAYENPILKLPKHK